MEIINRVIEIVDAHLIDCLIPIILTFILVEHFFKTRFETKKALNLVRWTILLYTLISWTVSLIEIAFASEESELMGRFRSYDFANWTILLITAVIPLTLFSKKLGSKFSYVLLAAFCMKIGVYIERFVILVSSSHRDYLPENGSAEITTLFLVGIGLLFLQGIIIALLTLGIFELIKKGSKR